MIASADKSCPDVQKFEWSKGNQYLRLDGGVNSQTRQQHTRYFNDPTSSVQVLEHFKICHVVKGSCLITAGLASMLFIVNSFVHEISHVYHFRLLCGHNMAHLCIT